MHTRRTAALTPLSLVLPHPPLPRRTSRLTPLERACSPRTPRPSDAPPPSAFFNRSTSAPRSSTDSWNSVKSDSLDDDIEWEWLTEQVMAITKALDTLPAHLLTPYNGVPPPNLLDKVARSLAKKNKDQWPHSVQATRAKLIEISRARALDDAIPEEELSSETAKDSSDTTTTISRRRTHRPSSMDILLAEQTADGGRIDRLSSRLQKIDRYISTPVSQTQSRPTSRATSPFPLGRPISFGSDKGPDSTTPAAETRNSGSSLSLSYTKTPRLRRSVTVISSLPPIQSGVQSPPAPPTPATAPRARATKGMQRAESYSSPAMGGHGQTLKRAPSFGASSIRSHASSKMLMDIDDDQKENTPQRKKRIVRRAPIPEPIEKIDVYPSSDEEEKARTKKAKKAKTKVSSGPEEAGSSVKSPVTTKKSSKLSTTTKSPTSTPSSSVRSKRSRTKVPVAALFGGELPNPQPDTALPDSVPFPVQHGEAVEVPGLVPLKTLRRVKTTSFPSRRAPAISTLPPTTEMEIESAEAPGVAAQLPQ